VKFGFHFRIILLFFIDLAGRIGVMESLCWHTSMLVGGSVLISDVAPGLSPAYAALKGGATIKIGHYRAKANLAEHKIR
jgi:hypothetical protein